MPMAWVAIFALSCERERERERERGRGRERERERERESCVCVCVCVVCVVCAGELGCCFFFKRVLLVSDVSSLQ